MKRFPSITLIRSSWVALLFCAVASCSNTKTGSNQASAYSSSYDSAVMSKLGKAGGKPSAVSTYADASSSPYADPSLTASSTSQTYAYEPPAANYSSSTAWTKKGAQAASQPVVAPVSPTTPYAYGSAYPPMAGSSAYAATPTPGAYSSTYPPVTSGNTYASASTQGSYDSFPEPDREESSQPKKKVTSKKKPVKIASKTPAKKTVARKPEKTIAKKSTRTPEKGSSKTSRTLANSKGATKGKSTPAKAVAKKTTPKSKAPAKENQKVIVKKGDTLTKIAQRAGVSLSQLKKANGLKSDVIRPGQKIATSS